MFLPAPGGTASKLTTPDMDRRGQGGQRHRLRARMGRPYRSAARHEAVARPTTGGRSTAEPGA